MEPRPPSDRSKESGGKPLRNTQSIPALEPKPDKKPDPVEEASKGSFPASDPPAHGAPDAAERVEPKAAPPAAKSVPSKKKVDKVDEASMDSFPASDPPGGTSHV